MSNHGCAATVLEGRRIRAVDIYEARERTRSGSTKGSDPRPTDVHLRGTREDAKKATTKRTSRNEPWERVLLTAQGGSGGGPATAGNCATANEWQWKKKKTQQGRCLESHNNTIPKTEMTPELSGIASNVHTCTTSKCATISSNVQLSKKITYPSTNSESRRTVVECNQWKSESGKRLTRYHTSKSATTRSTRVGDVHAFFQLTPSLLTSSRRVCTLNARSETLLRGPLFPYLRPSPRISHRKVAVRKLVSLAVTQSSVPSLPPLHLRPNRCQVSHRKTHSSRQRRPRLPGSIL